MEVVYIYNILSMLLIGVLSKKFGKKADHIFILFCIIQFTFLVGLRYEVGADWRSYENIYNFIGTEMTIAEYDFGYIEPGYALLNKLLFICNIPYWGLNLVIAYFTFYYVAKTIEMLSRHVVLSFYLFVSFFLFYQSMNQTRQMLALALGIYAIANLIKGSDKRFFIYLSLASAFHVSLLTLLPLFWLRRIEIKKRTILMYTIFPVLCVVFYEILLMVISHTRYAIYIKSGYDLKGVTSTILNLLVRVVMLCLSLAFVHRMENSEEKNCLYHMILLCTVFQVMTTYSALFGRITTNYFIAYVFLIPKIIDSIQEKKCRAVLYLACILCAALYHYVYYVNSAGAVGVDYYRNYLFL